MVKDSRYVRTALTLPADLWQEIHDLKKSGVKLNLSAMASDALRVAIAKLKTRNAGIRKALERIDDLVEDVPGLREHILSFPVSLTVGKRGSDGV